jgi:hypothetical protein
VKYRGLLNQVKAMRAQLAPSAGVRIVITGGLPADWKPEPAPPPGSDLARQHADFTRGRQPGPRLDAPPGRAAASHVRPEPEPVPEPSKPKIAGRPS